MNSISQRASSVVASPVFGGAIVLASLCVVGTLNTFAAEAASTNSPPLTLWDTTARATVGGGYRANILQSSIAPESSAFASSSVELSLARIAIELGFSSQSHFTRLFTGQTGTSPQRFRRLHMRMGE